MQSLSVKNTKYQIQYRDWSYRCHQRRLSEINKRKYSNDNNHINIIESSRRNKFFNSRRKEIKKQEEILSENQKLLNKIVNIKSSFYRSSSRQSISSNCSKLSDRSILKNEKNRQRIKDNSIIRQKISQMLSPLSRQWQQREPVVIHLKDLFIRQKTYIKNRNVFKSKKQIKFDYYHFLQ